MIKGILRTTFLVFLFANSYSYASSPNTLYIALGNEPAKGFDSTQGWGRYGNPLIQSTLLKRDKEFKLHGDLAQSWKLSEDRLSWSVEIRDDAYFSNGLKLTTDDVDFTFKQAQKSLSAHDLSNLKSIKILSPTRLIFNLKEPDITFIDHFSSLGIVSKEDYTPSYAQNPIGSGPYKFVKWKKGQSLTLVHNPYYYGKKPIFKSLVIVFGEEHSNVALFKTGQIHLTTLTQDYIKALPESSKVWAVETVDNRGIVWPVLPKSGEKGNDITSNLAIRKAIGLAINRELIVNELLEGYAKPATSVADSLPWGASPKYTSYDIEAAKKLLTNSGWIDKNNNGIREFDGVEAEIKLYYKSGDSVREKLAITISQMVKPLNISIQPIGADWDTISKNMHSSPVVMGFGSHSASEVNYLYNSEFAGVDFYNSGLYKNTKVDELLQSAKHAPSWEESLIFWREAQDLASQDEPWTWLINIDHLYATDSCLNLGAPITEPHTHGWSILGNIDEWRWTCQ
ncbi:ABC transporter substrate-binding protein [Vibrio rotiferianus]|uniref:ABC transporter substrate-binding protein n=1 Tax=Vibrio rotiferianus TaxID=190895 RepID=UPI00406A6552